MNGATKVFSNIDFCSLYPSSSANMKIIAPIVTIHTGLYSDRAYDVISVILTTIKEDCLLSNHSFVSANKALICCLELKKEKDNEIVLSCNTTMFEYDVRSVLATYLKKVVKQEYIYTTAKIVNLNKSKISKKEANNFEKEWIAIDPEKGNECTFNAGNTIGFADNKCRQMSIKIQEARFVYDHLLGIVDYSIWPLSFVKEFEGTLLDPFILEAKLAIEEKIYSINAQYSKRKSELNTECQDEIKAVSKNITDKYDKKLKDLDKECNDIIVMLEKELDSISKNG